MPTPDIDPARMGRTELVAALHEHLEATAHLPIDASTNRWLGEAEAVAADIADGTASDAVVEARAEQVVHLLESADEPEPPEAADNVVAALAIARELVEYTGEE